MTDVLEMQKNMVPAHVNESWPRLRSETHELPEYSGIEEIIVCGCGDSHHAGVGIAMGISKLVGIPCRAVNSMAASRYLVPRHIASGKNLLVVGISASGEVARTIEALEVANHIGAQTLAFTGDGSSTLATLAQNSLVLPGPDLEHGPGLISYLTSLMMGYALLHHLLDDADQHDFERALDNVRSQLEGWITERWDSATYFADQDIEGTCVFLGSGPAFGSALFGAAKLIEAAGEYAWAQDVEEWAHLEYFCAPAAMRTWLLSADGRCRSREVEVYSAALAIGRSWHEDRWSGLVHLSHEMNEIFAPLALWPGPCAYAARRAQILTERPFRDFGGGRDRREGGGPSRIRSSERQHKFGEK